MRFEEYLNPDSEEQERLGDDMDAENYDLYKLIDLFKTLDFKTYMDESKYAQENSKDCVDLLQKF